MWQASSSTGHSINITSTRVSGPGRGGLWAGMWTRPFTTLQPHRHPLAWRASALPSSGNTSTGLKRTPPLAPPMGPSTSHRSSSKPQADAQAPKHVPALSRLTRRGGKGPGGGGPGGPGVGRPSELQLLAGHAAYTGFVGTLAVVVASLADIDLFPMFQWGNLQHLELALGMMVPLLAANLLLLGPDWGDWKLPLLSADEEAVERAAARQAAAAGSSPAAAAGSSHAKPTATSASAASAAGTGASSSSGQQQVPAHAWGQSAGPSSLPAQPAEPQWVLQLRLLRDAANLAQGHYVANNPTAGISPVSELAVAALDSLSSEMLFRGVLITGLATWLRDRLYEAGWPDLVALPAPLASLMAAAAGGVPPDMLGDPALGSAAAAAPLDDVARWAAVAGLLVFLSLLSARRVARAAKKLEVMRDIRARIDTVREAQRKQREQAASKAAAQGMQAPAVGDRLPDAARGDGKPSSAAPAPGQDQPGAASTSTSAPAPQPPSSSKPAAQQEPRLAGPEGMAGSSLPPKQAAGLGMPLAMAVTGDGQLLGPPREAGGAFNAVVWSTALQASRDLLQSGTLSVLFVATGGNLAACFAASLVNQVVFSALQRLGRERTRKRSALLAEQLAEFNTKLKAIAEKKAAEKKAAEAAAQASAEAATPATPAAAAQLHREETAPSSSAPNAGATTPTAPQASSFDTSASGADMRSAASSATVAAAQPASPAMPSLPQTGLSRTLTMLDMLVPDVKTPKPAGKANKPVAPAPAVDGSASQQQHSDRD